MSSSVTITGDTGILQLPERFDLFHGGVLHGAQLAYQRYGPVDAPAVLVLGGISAGRHLTATQADQTPGWWQDFVGHGSSVDLDKYAVFGIDYLGGPGASTNADNSDGQAQPFPIIDAKDQARAASLLFADLGLARLRAVIGSSYGGMVGLCMAALGDLEIEQLLMISAADRSQPMATAWRSLQRKVLRFGLAHGDPSAALAIARGMAMTSYRSAAEFAQRFDSAPACTESGCRFPVEDYLDARGADFAKRFSANIYLCLSESIDLHRETTTRLHCRSTLVGVDTDVLVPFSQIEDLAARLESSCQVIQLRSIYGHDAFLKEVAQLDPILRSVLSGEEVQR